jgi:hypothetical protein
MKLTRGVDLRRLPVAKRPAGGWDIPGEETDFPRI